jgi:hypothetical protein
MSKKIGNCVVCGAKAVAATGYAFSEDGLEIVGIAYCSQHIKETGLLIANPVFQNRKALDLFMEKHPQLYTKNVKGKRAIFLEVVS